MNVKISSKLFSPCSLLKFSAGSEATTSTNHSVLEGHHPWLALLFLEGVSTSLLDVMRPDRTNKCATGATRNLVAPSIHVAASGARPGPVARQTRFRLRNYYRQHRPDAVICVTFFRPAIGYGHRFGQLEALRDSAKKTRRKIRSTHDVDTTFRLRNHCRPCPLHRSDFHHILSLGDRTPMQEGQRMQQLRKQALKGSIT